MEKNRNYCILCGVIAVFIIFVLLIFTITFVTVPLIYKKSIELQYKMVFPTSHLLPENPEFDNFEKYHVKGARNLNVTVNENDLVTLGVWHLLPHALVNYSLAKKSFDYGRALSQTRFPVILHFHSSGGNRIKYVKMYHVLRVFFHVIAFDYRGYGDSTNVSPTEEAIVQDSIHLFKWLRAQTPAEIFIWSHSLGAALGTHATARLSQDNISPTGLFLEAPFTSMRDQIQQTSFYKLFSWLPWYESTMLDPLEKNGLIFNTTKHIIMVECPIMIVHAEDDVVAPYSFGEKLFKTALEERTEKKGDVTFHLLPSHLHCGHFSISKAPQLLQYIWKHIETCRLHKKGRG